MTTKFQKITNLVRSNGTFFYIFIKKNPFSLVLALLVRLYGTFFYKNFFKIFFYSLNPFKIKVSYTFSNLVRSDGTFFYTQGIHCFRHFHGFSPLKWDFFLCFTNRIKCRILKNVNNYFGQKLVIHKFKIY